LIQVLLLIIQSNGTFPPITGDDFPQTSIRFLTGVHVSKELIPPIDGGEYQVKINMANINANTLKWFWIKESPSKYVDVSEINDNFNFSPFRIIIDRFVLGHTFNVLRDLYEDYFDTPQKLNQLREKINQYKQNFIYPLATQFDPYLSRYNIERSQRGIFKLVRDVPPLGQRYLTFKIKPSAFGTPCFKYSSVDNPAIKPPIASRYRCSGIANWKYLQPNPGFGQTVIPGPKPELEIDTCYDYFQLAMFYESLIGITPRTYENDPDPNKHEMLDSKDIEILGIRRNPDDLGLNVLIRNLGDARATTQLTAKSVFIPFEDPREPLSNWFNPFVCKVENFDITVEARQSEYQPTETNFKIPYSNMIQYNGSIEPIIQHYNLIRNFNGWVITTIDIDPASGELKLANNKAIEIKYFGPPRVPLSIWNKIVKAIKRIFSRFWSFFKNS